MHKTHCLLPCVTPRQSLCRSITWLMKLVLWFAALLLILASQRTGFTCLYVCSNQVLTHFLLLPTLAT